MRIEEKGSAEEFVRLKRERDEADRRYNDALTDLDAVVQKPREFPHPPRRTTISRSRRSTNDGSSCR